tara:strand:- start:162 stop:1163 length:1002 start_codon:yes stop_codon:yes gene_type:complete
MGNAATTISTSNRTFSENSHKMGFMNTIGRLDIDLLETFVAIAEAGSFTHAGERLNRTQPTISMQLKRLEERIGNSLFKRSGRRIELTSDGEALLAYAYRIINLSDEAKQNVSNPGLEGLIKVGLPEWFATDQLQGLLCRFVRAHPSVKLQMHVTDSATLRPMLERGDLDIALAILDKEADPPPRVWREPLYWVCGDEFTNISAASVALALFVSPCPFREHAAEALESIGRNWEEVFTSTSVAAIRVALLSGIGVSVFPSGAVTAGMRVLTPNEGFPDLPPTELSIYTAEKDPIEPIASFARYLTDFVGKALIRNYQLTLALPEYRAINSMRT